MKPNIIFLHSHNTGRHVQPYGHAVPTPHLQRLAEQGVLFRQAFAAAPTCSPSRASFLTGLCPHATGMLGLSHRGWDLAQPQRHVAAILRRAGYQTGLCGIEHTIIGQGGFHHDRSRQIDERGYDLELCAHGTDAGEIAAAVDAFLGQAGRQPFFLSIGLKETHTPFAEPDPRHYPAEDERYCTPMPLLPDVPEVRRDVAGFKASARHMDDCYGSIFASLDAHQLADRTLVCCFADHGLQFPRHMCNLTDTGLAVYLVVRGPEFQGGKVIDAMVSLLDLVPTVIEMTGAGTADDLHGRSLLPLVRGDVDRLHDELFGEVTYHAAYEPMRSVRTERFKYIRRYDQRQSLVLPNTDDGLSKDYLLARDWRQQPRHQEMLFDLVFDPHETNNLVERPALAAVLGDLRQRLETWMNDTDDPLQSGSFRPPSGILYCSADGLSPTDKPLVAD